MTVEARNLEPPELIPSITATDLYCARRTTYASGRFHSAAIDTRLAITVVPSTLQIGLDATDQPQSLSGRLDNDPLDPHPRSPSG